MKSIFTLTFLFATLFCRSQSTIIWSSPIDIASNVYSNQHPRIVADRSGNPMVVWGKFSSNEVYFSRWDDTVFTAPLTLNDSGQLVFTASWAGPDIASFGDTVYVVYKETPEDVNHIYLVRSFDGGRNFSSPVQVDQLVDSLSRFPTVTVDSIGNPVVAYMKFELGFINASYVVCRSNDFGNSFTPDRLASMYTGSNVCDCCPGAVVCSGSNTAMLYRDNFNNFRTIWCGISSDNSNSFPFGMSVDQTSWIINACPSSGPDGIIIGDSVYTVFMSGESGDARCYLSAASLSMFSAGSDREFTDTISGLSNQNYPRISAYGNRVGMVCRQTLNGDGQVPFFFTDDITTTGISQNFDTVAIGTISNADVVLTSDAVHIVWQDDNSETVKYRKGQITTSTLINNQVKLSDLILYPSPAKNYFFIRSQTLISTNSVKMFDMTGKRISLTTTEVTGGVSCRFQNAAPGIYTVYVTDYNQNSMIKKLVVE